MEMISKVALKKLVKGASGCNDIRVVSWGTFKKDLIIFQVESIENKYGMHNMFTPTFCDMQSVHVQFDGKLNATLTMDAEQIERAKNRVEWLKEGKLI